MACSLEVIIEMTSSFLKKQDFCFGGKFKSIKNFELWEWCGNEYKICSYLYTLIHFKRKFDLRELPRTQNSHKVRTSCTSKYLGTLHAAHVMHWVLYCINGTYYLYIVCNMKWLIYLSISHNLVEMQNTVGPRIRRLIFWFWNNEVAVYDSWMRYSCT